MSTKFIAFDSSVDDIVIAVSDVNANSSTAVFCRAQQSAQLTKLAVSDLKYRSIIRSALSMLHKSDYGMKEALTAAELIWSLLEAIFIKTHDSSIVTDLMAWARLYLAHTPYVYEISKFLTKNKVKQLNGQHFWLQIIYFVLSGNFNNAASFLQTYGNLTKDDAVHCLAQIIQEIDIDLLDHESTVVDFINFQKRLQEKCVNGVFETNPEAEKVALLIAGDIPTIMQIAPELDNWFELVPAYLLFVHPRATLLQIKEAVEDCTKIFGVSKYDGVDAVIFELLSLDALRALHQISQLSFNWWFPAHLADLLQKADERITSACGMNIRQHLVIEYGSSLFNNFGLWQVGCDYLREAGEEGLRYLELLIARVPFYNESVAIKLYSLCDEVGFDQIRQDIARCMAYRFLRKKWWSAALSWSIRSRDIEIVSSVADQVISLCPPHEFSSIVVIEHFTEVELISSSFVFLHRYCELRQILESNEKCKAVNLLVELMLSDFVPLKFHSLLFSNLIDILSDENEAILNRNDTEQLLGRLIQHEACSPFERDSNFWKTRLRTLRFLLLQNLARTIIS
ncbi:unnamed protein product [Thelazia callipaeda]|uniref:Nuclear pore complex protein Nup85 n=1 Tax=Thelazia callipaeda TaxID=103827 RepID=A0A158RB44_THECL|nr:unnamed protein product [Thelazia callipaeda]